MPSEKKKKKDSVSLSDLAAAIFATPGSEALGKTDRMKAIKDLEKKRRNKNK